MTTFSQLLNQTLNKQKQDAKNIEREVNNRTLCDKDRKKALLRLEAELRYSDICVRALVY